MTASWRSAPAGLKQSRPRHTEKVYEGSAHEREYDRLVFSGQSKFQRIEIFQTVDFGKMLVLDGDPNSSELDEDIYHESLVHPALLTCPSPKSVLILGGGEGATLREVLRHPEVEKAVMVDLDEMVVGICRKELPSYSDGAFDDPRAKLTIQDANIYLKETNEKFDCVISDLTEPHPESPTFGLLTRDFFGLIKSRLNPDGIFAMQASQVERGNNRIFLRHVENLKKVWRVVRPYKVFIPSFFREWGFAIASDGPDPLKSSPEEIDKKLSRISSKLHFYDGAVHPALFAFPKEMRARLI